MRKNDVSKKTNKGFGKLFFIYIFLVVIFTLILVGILTALILNGYLPLGTEMVLITVPILICLNGSLTYICFYRFFINFGILENSLESIASGNYKTRIADKKAGVFQTTIDNFNTMAEELDNNQTLSSDFVHNFSHEFKTPISSINGFAKLLQEDDISEEDRKKYLDIIVSESKRLTKLSEKTLMLIQLNSNTLINDRQEYSLDEQVKKAIILFQDKAKNKSINVRTNLEEITYFGNSELMNEVWINLISNAFKYTNEGGKISITLRKDRKNIIFTIKDTGIGIPKNKQKYIFNEYYQVDESHSTKGVGLGLSIVKKIVDNLGGNISLDSKENEGSTFKVIIPKE